MHERSFVKTLIEQVINEARSRHLGRIHGVKIQIGEFSGFEPSLVESAFAEMTPDYWNTQVELTVDIVPLTGHCNHCGALFHIKDFRFVCSNCGKSDIKITEGEEMTLISIRAEAVKGELV